MPTTRELVLTMLYARLQPLAALILHCRAEKGFTRPAPEIMPDGHRFDPVKEWVLAGNPHPGRREKLQGRPDHTG